VDFVARSQATYLETKVLGLRMEPMPSRRPDLAIMTLRLEPYMDGSVAGSAFVDSFYLWPSTDLVSAHGHNLDPQL